MVPINRVTPFAVRAWRMTLVLAPAVALVVGGAGCGHRRSALRPVYGTPAPATPILAAPEAACPTGTPMTTSPVTADPFLNPSGLSPAPTLPGGDVTRAGGGSPPAADTPAEPPLSGPEPSSYQGAPTTSTSGVSLNRPGSSRATGRQSSTSSRRPRVALRDAVQPYVENPEELFAPPKADRPWKYVVLHHSASAEGGYDQIDRDHRKVLGFEGCGYHFVIGNGTDSPDGQIEVADRWLNQKNGVHCRNGKTPEVNEYGIGICLVGNFDETEPTARQVAAAKALVAYLASRYAIPADHLGTHEQFAASPTACPGKNFPTEAILGTNHMAQR